MLRRSFLLFSATFLFVYSAFSGTIIREYKFNPPSVTDKSGMVTVEMDGCVIAGSPGEPALPVYGVRLLLPPGEVITSIEITSTSGRIITDEGIELDPIQEPYPISFPGPINPTPGDPAIYGSDELFPKELTTGMQSHFMCGYSIGYFSLYPVQYRPVSGEISYFPSITVEITTSTSAEAVEAHGQNYRGSAADRNRLQGKVENPEESVSYGALIEGTDDPNIPYLLITTASMADFFIPLLEFKNTCGYPTEMVMMSEILSNYSGMDDQDKIRNCIMDYYQNFNTSYVLLGADDEFLPHRGLYATLSGEIDYDIPGDIYYAGLDGNWDYDGDGIFGETGEGDLVAEVIIGRAAVDDVVEAINFTYKQLLYQSNPVVGELELGLMVGEDLGWITWGSDLKEEIRLGTYYTAGFSANFTVNTLYETPSWSFSGMNDLRPLLNDGAHLVNHMGHCNTTYMMKLNNSHVTDYNFTNNGINHNFYIVYSQGCYCGSFDNRTGNGSYVSDCISEKFSTIAHGAVCMITNSRYGWGNYSGTNGPSQFYDREFFDALFGEDIFLIGEANQDSKEDNIPFLSVATLWVYYQLNLFGDPMLDIWTAEPMALNPNHSPNVILGSTEFTVEVPGVTGAFCAMSDDNGLLGTAYTDEQGTVVIEFPNPVFSQDTLTLAITYHNYLPYIVQLGVAPPDIPCVIVDEATINDEDFGDGDSILDLGESGYFALNFHNIGLMEATGVHAELTCEDVYINILNDSVYIGIIPPESVIEMDEAFEFAVSTEVEDGHEINCLVTIRDGVDSVWTQNFEFQISAPVIIVSEVEIINGENGHLPIGGTPDIQIILGNIGSGELRYCTADVMTDNPHITVYTSSASAELIESGENAALEPALNLKVLPTCPENSVIPFYLEISDEPGYHHQIIFELAVGGFFDDMEGGAVEWTHENCTVGYEDQWHLTSNRNHTPDGSCAWHNGEANGGNYHNLSDAGLITPMMEYTGSAKLIFWHWMEAETSSAYPGEAFDGGMVEMSYNGSPFFQLFPEGGYPYTIRESSSQPCPFAAGTPVYSGQHDWEEAVFDLAIIPLGGEVQFRFRFGSDGAVTGEGWYIDDVKLVFYSPIAPPSNFNVEGTNDPIHLTWNSPVFEGEFEPKSGSRQGESLLSYNVYRNSELLADGIAALEYFDPLEGMPFGEYAYQVSALFSQGESQLTEPIIVEFNGMSAAGNSSDVPGEYSLDQNWPNPFNPETNFRFGLPEGGEVSLVIYNIMGREIVRLADGFKPAGYHNISWKAENLPSGIYLYRLKAADFTACGKMLLIK